MASESRQEKVGISSGFGYSTDVSSTHIVNQMQSFESNPELYNLTTGMEMLTTAFPSKNRDGISGSNLWKGSGFFNKPTTDFYQTTTTTATDFSDHHHHHQSSSNHENLIDHHHSSWQTSSSTAAAATDDSSLRYVVNPCETPQRPSQGLSLSLSNSNHPSTIGLQSFELRGENQQDGFFGKSPNFQQQQQHQIMQSSSADHHGFVGIRSGSSSGSSFLQQNHLHLKNSKFLVPAQELLNEFCNLGTKHGSSNQPKKKPHKIDNSIDDENGSGSSSKHSFLYSLDLLELQKRKTKLLSMLEEVDRRYRQYCDQMKGVVSSFEAVVGNGGASAYSTLASKAMSKHFRCLRDGIVEQIKATRKAMGEKDIPIAPGTTKGETPRLRVLDQTLRQQRAFQQMSMLESHPWRPQRGLPERSVSVLRAWLFEHFLHPYPSDVDKHILARQTGLSRSQVSNWFINARVRLWKPMVEEMYLEETKEQDNYIPTATTAASSSSDWITNLEDSSGRLNEQSQQQQPQYLHSEDHKPTHDQLVRGDSESLSSIINIQNDTDHQNVRNHQHFNHHNQGGRQMDQRHQPSTTHDHGFGIMNLDFSAAYNNDSMSQNIGNGVSLTLGLQQHGGNGMSLSFSPASHHQHSLFFPRDQMGDCDDDQVQYSLLDGEAAQNLPYRNLMGAQLLHDLV